MSDHGNGHGRGTILALVAAVLVCLALSSLVAYSIHAARRKVRDVALAALAHNSTDRRKRALEKAAYAMYLPRAGALEWLSVGNRNVAAYFLLLKANHYITLEFRRSGQKLRWLATMYRTILDLDPHWRSVYYLAAVMLSTAGDAFDAHGRAVDLDRRCLAAARSLMQPVDILRNQAQQLAGFFNRSHCLVCRVRLRVAHDRVGLRSDLPVEFGRLGAGAESVVSQLGRIVAIPKSAR